MKTPSIVSVVCSMLIGALVVTGCGKNEETSDSTTKPDTAVSAEPAATVSAHPGTEEGARALLDEFLKPGADYATLSKALRPNDADYAAMFDGPFADRAKAVYAPAWDAGEMIIAPKEGQSELKIWGATTEDLRGWTGNAAEFPGGYKDVAANLKDGLTIYRFKFVAPGEDLGMAFDGLVYVNDHWTIFPKPWKVE